MAWSESSPGRPRETPGDEVDLQEGARHAMVLGIGLKVTGAPNCESQRRPSMWD